MAEPLTRPGGLVPWATNEKITSTGLTRMGQMAKQTLLNGVMARLFRADCSTDPQSGVFGADDFLCTATGDLEVTVSPGVAFVLGSGTSYSEDYALAVLDAEEVLTLDAHDSDPRIDRIIINDTTVDEISEAHDVKDPTTGTITSTPEYTRRRLTCFVQVVSGTPAASPVAPSTPSGWISIATVRVPATSGPGVVTDTRPILEFAIEKLIGDLEMQSGKQVTFENPVTFENALDMEALCLAVDAGKLAEVSAGGSWATDEPGDNTANIDGDGAAFMRNRIVLSVPTVNDEINIPLDRYLRPGCGISYIKVIAESDSGTVTLDARLGSYAFTGTGTAVATIDTSNAVAVAAASRNTATLFFDQDVARVHGSDNGSGSKFYNLRLRVTAVSGSTLLVIYGIVIVWATSESFPALGASAE